MATGRIPGFAGHIPQYTDRIGTSFGKVEAGVPDAERAVVPASFKLLKEGLCTVDEFSDVRRFLRRFILVGSRRGAALAKRLASRQSSLPNGPPTSSAYRSRWRDLFSRSSLALRNVG